MNKLYMKIWMLLASSFVIFLISSIYLPIKIGEVELLSSDIYQTITKTQEQEPQVEAIEESPVELVSDTPIEVWPKLDTMPQRILIMGDSMLEGLAPRLAAYAKKNNHKLFSAIWYSSSSKTWATSSNIEDLIEKYKPTYIFFSLGANELFIKNIEELRDGYVKTIVQKLGDIPYVWIGPPNKMNDTGINNLLQKNVPEDKFFLTRGMDLNYTDDQIHPTREAAITWIDSVVRWMPNHCHHLIKLDMPDKAKDKPDTIEVLKTPLK